MHDETRPAGKSWRHRSNAAPDNRMTDPVTQTAPKTEWYRPLGARSHEWALLGWFSLAWAFALRLPAAASTLEKMLLVPVLLLPLMLLAVSRYRVRRALDDMRRRAELRALGVAGGCAMAMVCVQVVLQVLQLPWSLQPMPTLMVLGLAYGLARCVAMRHDP